MPLIHDKPAKPAPPVFGPDLTHAPAGVPGNRTVLAQANLQKLTTFWTKYFAAGGGTLHMSQNLSLN